ncbi:hypothetical protein D3C85_1473280 [compost metagenome]
MHVDDPDVKGMQELVEGRHGCLQRVVAMTIHPVRQTSAFLRVKETIGNRSKCPLYRPFEIGLLLGTELQHDAQLKTSLFQRLTVKFKSVIADQRFY